MDRFDEMRGKITFSAGGEGGGAVIIPPEAGNLVSIMFESLPVKVDYNEGDNIDIKGLKVVAKFDNDVYVDVTNACQIVVDSPITVYTKTVSVVYEGLEIKYDVTVYAKPKGIPSNALYLYHFNNSKINEIDGTTVSYGTLLNSGKFNGCIKGFSKTMDKLPTLGEMFLYDCSYTFSFWIYFTGNGAESNGSDHWYPFSYQDDDYYSRPRLGLTLSNDDTVNLRVLYGSNSYTSPTKLLNTWTHIAITINNGYVRLFVNGKSAIGVDAKRTTSLDFDSRGLYSNGNRAYIDELLITNSILYTSDFEPPKNEYGGERVLKKIYIEKQPSRTIYKSGETFSLDGAVIKAVFSNGAFVNVTNDCVIEDNIPITLKDTHRVISYTYDGITKKEYINVGAYTTEEEIDLSSAKLLMNFDGNTEDLTGINKPTIVGNSLYGEGKFGQARYFNGSTDYISMPYTEDINIDTGDFTIAFWVKGTVTSNIPVFLSIFKSSNSINTGLRCGLNSGKLFVTFSSAEGTALDITNNTYPVNISNWLHIAIVRKGNNMACYENGKLVNSVTYEGRLYFGNNVIIGARDLNGMTNFYNGYIDDLIIAKSALWEDEFIPPVKPYSVDIELDELALYELNDGGGVE